MPSLPIVIYYKTILCFEAVKSIVKIFLQHFDNSYATNILWQLFIYYLYFWGSTLPFRYGLKNAVKKEK